MNLRSVNTIMFFFLKKSKPLIKIQTCFSLYKNVTNIKNDIIMLVTFLYELKHV